MKRIFGRIILTDDEFDELQAEGIKAGFQNGKRQGETQERNRWLLGGHLPYRGISFESPNSWPYPDGEGTISPEEQAEQMIKEVFND